MIVHNEIDIIVYYTCPKCEWIHGLNPRQYLHKSFLIVCECGAELIVAAPTIKDFAPYSIDKEISKYISSPDHQPVLADNPIFVDRSKNSEYAENILAAVSILTTQGFSKKEVEKTIIQNKIKGSIDEIVSQTLSYL